MTKDEFIETLHNNYDEEIRLDYFHPLTGELTAAHFYPTEHGREYCDVTYVDTRNQLFYRLNRPIYRGAVFMFIDGLENLLQSATISYHATHLTGDYFEKRDKYRQEYKEKVEKVEERKARKKSKKGVYVIKAGRYIKIGVTTNFASRLNTMQTASAETFELICFFDGASYELEGELHKIFGRHRVRGEWFSLKIKDKILKLHSEYRPTGKQANA